MEEFVWDVVNYGFKKFFKIYRNLNVGIIVVDSEFDSLFDVGSVTFCILEFIFIKFGVDVLLIFIFSGEKEKIDISSIFLVR